MPCIEARASAKPSQSPPSKDFATSSWEVAIPMEKLTERKVTFLHSVINSAYDAKSVKTYIGRKGRIPLFDPNKRRGSERMTFTPLGIA